MTGLYSYARPEPAGRLTWRWRCLGCQMRGLKGQGEAVAKHITALRGAMRHNAKRHVGFADFATPVI